MLKLFAILIAAGVVIEAALVACVCISIGAEYKAVPSDCMIVLGAKVKPNGVPSDSLRYRLEAAYAAYEKGLAKNIIVCGGQGADEPMPEACAMRDYLVNAGVPESNVFMDDTSKNTLANIKNAGDIMRVHGFQTAIVVTADYHLRRALWIARDLGLSATGVKAESSKLPKTMCLDRLRESASWVKYFFGKLF